MVVASSLTNQEKKHCNELIDKMKTPVVEYGPSVSNKRNEELEELFSILSKSDGMHVGNNIVKVEPIKDNSSQQRIITGSSPAGDWTISSIPANSNPLTSEPLWTLEMPNAQPGELDLTTPIINSLPNIQMQPVASFAQPVY